MFLLAISGASTIHYTDPELGLLLQLTPYSHLPPIILPCLYIVASAVRQD